jgi:hypothetical protein
MALVVRLKKIAILNLLLLNCFLDNSTMPGEPIQCIFSILLKRDNSKLLHLGTGFFIGKHGLFFTAGHTFRKIKNEIENNDYSKVCIAFPSNQSRLFSIDSLCYQSFYIYQQKGPAYRDSAVGKICYENENYLIFNRKRPRLKDTLKACGYHNIKLDRLHNINNSLADLSQIQFKETEVEVIYNDALISDLKEDFQIPRENVNKNRFFNNCVTVDQRLIKGESGCPIIYTKGLVRGVFIGSSQVVDTSDIILSKYCTKFIKYKTYYKHDMYEDLSFR